MVKTSKKSRREPANKEHLAQVADEVHRRNLEIIKRQNRNYLRQKQRLAGNSRKRSRSNESSESESDQIVKRCYEEWLQEEEAATSSTEPTVNDDGNDDEDDDDKVAKKNYKNWRRDEYDTYNAINRKTLLSKIDMFEKMMKPTKKVDCGPKSLLTSDSNKILWTSPTYIAQYIRKCILKREWTELAHLLLLLTRHSHLYESYTREMAFLTTLMSIDKCDKDLLAHLELCFVKERAQGAKEFDVWYVEKSANETEDSC